MKKIISLLVVMTMTFSVIGVVNIKSEEVYATDQIVRPKEMRIGAIRWDAYNMTTGNEQEVSSQVAKGLSLPEFHGQVPFFGNISNEGEVSFPEYTVDTWNKEAKYAADAGLDYYAYLWYETTGVMSNARKAHLASPYKDTISMCAILSKIQSDETMNELYTAMKDSCYLTVDGRPVVFLYQVDKSWNANMVSTLRSNAELSGVENELYIIGMTSSQSEMETCMTYGIDALSWYGISAPAPATEYSVLAEKCENFIDSVALQKYQMVPTITTGMYCLARIKTGVSWIPGDPNAEDDADKPYSNRYALPGTPQEIAAHADNVLEWIENNPSLTQANLALTYAWNEHDEGGWLCPTLSVGEDGNVIYDSEGNAVINTSILDEFSNTIQEHKNKVVEVPTDTEEEQEVIEMDGSILKGNNSNFEKGTGSWMIPFNGTISRVENPDGDGYVMKFSNMEKKWDTPSLNIKNLLQEKACPGDTVRIEMDLYSPNLLKTPMEIRVKNVGDLSIATENTYPMLSSNTVQPNHWTKITGQFQITEEDLKSDASYWRLGLDSVQYYTDTVYIDNVKIYLDRNVVVSEDIAVEGYQISSTLVDSNGCVGGIRVVGSVEPVINEKQIQSYGLIYSLNEVNGTNFDVSADDMVIGSENSYIRAYESTSLGIINSKMGSSDTATYFARTMSFGAMTNSAYTAKYSVRGYAKLTDGSYVYSKVSNYTVVDVADILYKKCLMSTFSGHDFLYNNILKLIYDDYKEVDYEWSGTIVKPEE